MTEVGSPDRMIGRRIGGYRVESLLGEGGMGRVYLLVHTESPELKRVLKVLHVSVEQGQQFVERFRREARSAASLRHRNIVEILDYSRFSEDGRPYLEMAYLDGVELGTYVERTGAKVGHRGRISFETALPLLLQMCAALKAAHSRGIVHRDVKPSNCYVVQEGERPRVVLLDFGIAKILDPALRLGPTTRSRAVLGTPGFWAPEQARGRPIDHRADIYSFGVVAYLMLTGKQPFTGNTSEDLAIQQVNTTPPTPGALIPDLSDEVSRLIMRCLAPAPEGRPESMTVVAQCLMDAAPNGRDVAREFAPDLLSTATLVAGPTEPTMDGRSAAAVTPLVSGAAGTWIVVRKRLNRRTAGISLGLIGLVSVAVVSLRFTERSRASSVSGVGGTSDTPAAEVGRATSRPPAVVPAARTAPKAATASVSAATVATQEMSTAGHSAPTVEHKAKVAEQDAEPVLVRTAEPKRSTARPRLNRSKSESESKHRVTGSGTLSIKAVPWAEVWVDGRKVGHTPVLESIAAGRHKVRLVGPKGVNETVRVTIEPNKETKLSHDWSKSR